MNKWLTYRSRGKFTIVSSPAGPTGRRARAGHEIKFIMLLTFELSSFRENGFFAAFSAL